MKHLFALALALLTLALDGNAFGQIANSPMMLKSNHSCGAVAHGETSDRIRYSATTAASPATCQQETQSATCINGTLGSYTGTYTHTSCTETRTRYSGASTTCPAACTSESQNRVCTGGSCGAWSGTYAQTSCTQNTTSENRTRFSATSTTCPTACLSQVQSRSCSVSNNDVPGTWGAWSGTYTQTSCTQNTTSENRTRYAASSTTCPTACASQVQSRTCSVSSDTVAGTWGAWSGTYAQTSCTQNTTSQNRTRYASSSTTCPTACSSQNQSRNCNVSSNTVAGTWGSWSGTYSATSCVQNGTSQNADYYTCWGMCTFSCAYAGQRTRNCNVSNNNSPGSWGGWSPNGSLHFSDSGCNNTY